MPPKRAIHKKKVLPSSLSTTKLDSSGRKKGAKRKPSSLAPSSKKTQAGKKAKTAVAKKKKGPAKKKKTEEDTDEDSDTQEGSSSEGEEEEDMFDKKAGKVVRWYWAGDSSKKVQQDVWVRYDHSVAAKLEAQYQKWHKAPKSKKKKLEEADVDDERFVDLQNMFQRRYDARHLRRLVLRALLNPKKPENKDASQKSDEESSEEEEEEEEEEATEEGESQSSAEESSEDEEELQKYDIPGTKKRVVYYWAGDSPGGGHQDVWIKYSPKLCKRFERAFNSGRKKVKVDDERFVDLQNMLQRRHDDHMKRRMVKRKETTLKKKVAAKTSKNGSKKTGAKKTGKGKKALSAKAKGKQKRDESDSEEEEEDLSDEELSDSEEEESSLKTPAADDLSVTGKIFGFPGYWESMKGLDTVEIEVPKADAEFVGQRDMFVNTIDQNHVRATHIHKVSFSTFDVTRLVRVQNPMMWLRYHTRKQKIVKDLAGSTPPVGPATTTCLDSAANEYYFYHGLNGSFITGITRFGFDPRYCSLEGMFGAGLYFAENSSKSNQYVHTGSCTLRGPSNVSQCKCLKKDECCMLVCRVLLGDTLIEKNYRGNYKKGDFWYGRRTEPKKADGSIYHSVVGESRPNYSGAALNLREYIVYESSQVYPEYLLYYKRK